MKESPYKPLNEPINETFNKAPYKKQNTPLDETRGKSLSKQETFVSWISQYEKLLRHMINGFEAIPAVQEELFQEIALNIWRALETFRHDSAVKTFVARIAHNVLATHVAKAVKTVKTVHPPVSDDDGYQSSDQQPPLSQQPTPYQSLAQSQRQAKLAQAIRQLTLEQQQVITMALEGMSYLEIADVLAITTNLVGVRLQRAKTALMQLLEAV